MYRLTLNLLCAQANVNLATILLPNTPSAGIADKYYHTGLKMDIELDRTGKCYHGLNNVICFFNSKSSIQRSNRHWRTSCGLQSFV